MDQTVNSSKSFLTCYEGSLFRSKVFLIRFPCHNETQRCEIWFEKCLQVLSIKDPFWNLTKRNWTNRNFLGQSLWDQPEDQPYGFLLSTRGSTRGSTRWNPIFSHGDLLLYCLFVILMPVSIFHNGPCGHWDFILKVIIAWNSSFSCVTSSTICKKKSESKFWEKVTVLASILPVVLLRSARLHGVSPNEFSNGL